MAQKEMQTMMKGAAILTLASFIAKILSAIYRVPFQNLVGDEGFYVYQQVYPIYGIAMTLALSGFPQFISKIVAEQTNEQEEKQIIGQLYPFVFLLSIIGWGICFFGSGFIAQGMGDSNLRLLLKIVSFTFLLVPILSFYRGYFQGHLYMVPSGISQVLEQLIRVGIILIAAFAFANFHWSIYQTGAVAMSGAVFGGVVAGIVLWMYGKKMAIGNVTTYFSLKIKPSTKGIFQRLLIEGGLVSLYSAFLILFQLIDSFFVKNSLVLAGVSDKLAKIDKGIYDRGQPLVQLGLVVALALSSTFLPVLTRHFVQEKTNKFYQTAKIFLRLTTTIASAASVGLMMLLPFVNFALFKDNQGNIALSIYIYGIVLMAVIQAYQSIMQSHNEFIHPIIAASVGIGFKLLLTSPLTHYLGTIGAGISTIAGLLATLVVIILLAQQTFTRFWYENHYLKKLVLSLLAMVVVLFVYQQVMVHVLDVLAHRSWSFFAAILGVLIGGSVFVFISIKVQLLTVREWLFLPFGAKILRLKR